MDYVDGFVAAVPSASREGYRAYAAKAAVMFRDHGALRVVETWGNDVPDGQITSFPMAVQKQADETVVFSWIIWPSKEARDDGWKKIMDDPRMKEAGDMPFDGKRMIYGGFDVIVDQ